MMTRAIARAGVLVTMLTMLTMLTMSTIVAGGAAASPLGAQQPAAGAAALDSIHLISVADLLTAGFRASRVVMMNEAHAGLERSVRTRMVGRLVLPRAHALGVRYLAAEALTPEIARVANSTRVLPAAEGYLAQPDFRALLQDALDLGWTLIAYDPEELPTLSDPLQSLNWRDEHEARNLAAAVAALPRQARVLVWCGDSHLKKVPASGPKGVELRPMGYMFRRISGIDPFVIDQTVTVDFDGTTRRSARYLPAYRAALDGSAQLALGFLDPAARATGIDAKVISLDNVLR